MNGNAVAYRYRVDTTGANSGSPVIWTVFSDIYTVGIHTNAGCEDDGTGSNVGTAFEVTALQTAINNSPGPNRRYVDWAQSYINFEETGWMFRPFDTVAEGVNSTPNGGTVSIVAGYYNETLTINRPIRLVAPVGDVKIGQ